jgi:hypothetical protein
MASNYWIKLYHEALHDPKMCRLSDRLYRRAIELFLMAGETAKDGILPPVADIAWSLRVNEEILETELYELQKVGILSQVDGEWLVTNFAKRQAKISDEERAKQYRERKRKEEYYEEGASPTLPSPSEDGEGMGERDGNEDDGEASRDASRGRHEGVTVASRNVNRIDIESDTDIDKNRVDQSVAATSAAAPTIPEKKPENGRDPRLKHPAIIAFRSVTGRLPNKALFDRVIAEMGLHPDVKRLRECFQAWVSRGKNQMSIEVWLYEWYHQGIPAYGVKTPSLPSPLEGSGQVERVALTEEEREAWLAKELERRRVLEEKHIPYERFTLDEEDAVRVEGE